MRAWATVSLLLEVLADLLGEPRVASDVRCGLELGERLDARSFIALAVSPPGAREPFALLLET